MTLDVLNSLLAAVIVLLMGTAINRKVAFLSKYNIPDPITGGLVFAAIAAIAWIAAEFQVSIDQTFKPLLLLICRPLRRNTGPRRRVTSSSR